MQVINLEHSFKDKIPDLLEFSVYNGQPIDTIAKFHRNVAKLSKQYSTRIDSNKFKGDSLELLVEYLIKLNGSDNRIGIHDYHPIFINDTGVDGVGIGINNKPATVQVKYRHPDYILTANGTDEEGQCDNLMSFYGTSFGRYGVPVECDTNMLIVTTAKDVSEFTMQEMFCNKVRCLNFEHLSEMLDNRDDFWSGFFKSIEQSKLKVSDSKPIVLRKHQKDAVIAAYDFDEPKGKIIMPTGSGKTYTICEIIVNSINNGARVIQINSPRILLCWQLLEETYKYLLSSKVNAHYINFNSGKYDDETKYLEYLQKNNIIYRQIETTTSVAKVKNKIENATVPVIIVSTYHSADRLKNIEPDIIIHDEAHNLVSLGFTELASVKAKKHFFFTATEKNQFSNESIGMNNIELFGNYVFTISPREMIERGEMLPPYIQFVRPMKNSEYDKKKLENDPEAIFRSIYGAFLAHERQLYIHSKDPDIIGAKVLVVMRGQADLERIFGNSMKGIPAAKSFEKFKKDCPNIHIFALSSEFGIYYDGEHIPAPVSSIKKHKMMEQLKSLDSNERAIIFHVDMIGEGIDIPGITGIMPYRNLGDIKLFQTIGRACRLHPLDREAFYNKEICIENRRQWIKQAAWLILPELLIGSEDIVAKGRDMVQKLREDYGFYPSENNVFIDYEVGLRKEDPPKTVNQVQRDYKNEKSGLDECENQFEELIDIFKMDEASLLKRRRIEIENLIARLITDTEFKKVSPEDIRSNLAIVSLLEISSKNQKIEENINWDIVLDKHKKIYFDTMRNIYKEDIAISLEKTIQLLGSNVNKFEEYFDRFSRIMIDAIKNDNEELFEMAKAELSSENTKKIFGEVFTPMSLCNEMLNKLPKDVWKNPDYKWLDPACGSGNFLVVVKNRLMRTLKDVFPDKEERKKHILENMLFGVDIQPKNTMLCFLRLDPENKYNLEKHIICANSLKYDYNMEFDIIIGNPPYNSPSNNKGANNILWDKFVIKSIDLLRKNGYLCFVHPGLWRKPGHKMFKYFADNNLIYLEIHNENDGKKVFGSNVNTRYDWYILQKAPYNGLTQIKDEKSVINYINIKEMGWLPNSMYEEVKKLLASDENVEKCKIIKSRSNYGADKKWMSKEQTDEFKYPCVYSVNRKNEISLRWSSINTNGHFNIPKVIFGTDAVGFYVDKKGEYGLTQWCTGIVDEVENLDKIVAALNSDKLKEIMEATTISKVATNADVLALFRKDFWKEFIEEKEITNETE